MLIKRGQIRQQKTQVIPEMQAFTRMHRAAPMVQPEAVVTAAEVIDRRSTVPLELIQAGTTSHHGYIKPSALPKRIIGITLGTTAVIQLHAPGVQRVTAL